MARPRILFVGPHFRFVNPTGQLLPAMLAEVGDVVCYGPGFVGEGILQQGLDRFLERHGPVDAAVTTELVAFHRNITPLDATRRRRLARIYWHDFPLSQLDHLPRICREFSQLRCPRFLSLLQSDLYGWREYQVEQSLSTADYLLSNGPENSVRVADMRRLEDEPWAQKANDRFVDFVDANSHRVISFPLFVAADEFNFTRLSARRVRWEVPGIQYISRRIARERLARRGVKMSRVTPSRITSAVARLSGRYTGLSMQLANYFFRRQLQRAQAVYTCGSVLRQPVRKFFEIPAAGALLVCEPCAGLTDMGFRHEVNCLLHRPEEVDVADDLLTHDLERAEAIAAAGQSLVLASHSLSGRAAQFARCLEAIRCGSFAGARWQRGSFVVAERASSPLQPPVRSTCESP